MSINLKEYVSTFGSNHFILMAFKVEKTNLPSGTIVNSYIPIVDYKDAYAFQTFDPGERIEDIYVKLFNTPPSWIRRALQLRNAIVAPLGLKTEFKKKENLQIKEGEKAGIFVIYKITENEIIAGEDDKHLNFRVSVHRAVGNPSTVTVSTLVHYNNLFGRFYMGVISPFHKLVVKSILNSAKERFNTR